MKRIKWLLFLMVAVILTACSSETDEEVQLQELEENQIYMYFVNRDKTDVFPVVYSVQQNENVGEEISNIVMTMTNMDATVDYQTPILEEFVYTGIEYDEKSGSVKLAFNLSYETIDAEELLFFKTCVSMTVLQIKGVDNVSIALTDVANSDTATATVTENFDNNSFTMNFGDKSGYKQSGTIILYFANENGDALKEYQKAVEISNNTSLAKVVLEALISGPELDGYTATIPEETKINNVSVKDSICYVDLSDEFYDTSNPLRNDMIVYSVVNSLVELPTVSKVQFLKNGEKLQLFRETLPFDGIFERNLDIIEQEDNE